MSVLTVHVLDAAEGSPAAGLGLTLERVGGGVRATAATDSDGRIDDLPHCPAGNYRLTFATEAYFTLRSICTIYPIVVVEITLGTDGHKHVPLLLGPFSYATTLVTG